MTADLGYPDPLQIRYWKAGDKEAAADRVRTAGLDTSARVTDLHPNTKYHVTVRAYNRAGTGPTSPSTNATTMKPRESVGPGRGPVCLGWGASRVTLSPSASKCSSPQAPGWKEQGSKPNDNKEEGFPLPSSQRPVLPTLWTCVGSVSQAAVTRPGRTALAGI